MTTAFAAILVILATSLATAAARKVTQHRLNSTWDERSEADLHARLLGLQPAAVAHTLSSAAAAALSAQSRLNIIHACRVLCKLQLVACKILRMYVNTLFKFYAMQKARPQSKVLVHHACANCLQQG